MGKGYDLRGVKNYMQHIGRAWKERRDAVRKRESHLESRIHAQLRKERKIRVRK